MVPAQRADENQMIYEEEKENEGRDFNPPKDINIASEPAEEEAKEGEDNLNA